MLEGGDARRAVAESGRRSTSRRELSARRGFEDVSPEVGELDEHAFADLLDSDPDAALTLLAELTGATDERLRSLARALAARVVVDLARHHRHRRHGIGRLRRTTWAGSGDVDLDASLGGLVTARAEGRSVVASELFVTAWQQPTTSLCLLVDRSGSMHGERLATAAVTAAAVLHRRPDSSVVAFAEDAVVLTAQGQGADPATVAGDLLALRGHGTTDVALALRAAADQLARGPAGRRVALLLSDCRSTTGVDPADLAGVVDELAVLAPAGDTADASRLADAFGGRVVELRGPSSAPEAVRDALGD